MLRWDSYKDAVHVSEEHRLSFVKKIKSYLLTHPDEPFYYIATGDTMIVGFSFKNEISIYDCKVRRQTLIDKIIEPKPIIDMSKDKVRFRTLKVFKDWNCGMVGRIVAVTVPLDKENKIFAVDFSFCSIKDKFNKSTGKDIALNRLYDKITNKKDITIINRGEGKINDIIKNLIVEEYGKQITWLRNVKSENIV